MKRLLQRPYVYDIIKKANAINVKGIPYMALGEFNFFVWKSKEQVKREEEEYAKWAFPYGGAQRGKLVKLMLEVFPKENEATTLIPFLTCKELYMKICKTPEMTDYAVEKLMEMQKYKRLIRKQDMPYYVALVVADSRIDENLDYPTADEIRQMAKGFIVTKE
jgi:hypothetical protein